MSAVPQTFFFCLFHLFSRCWNQRWADDTTLCMTSHRAPFRLVQQKKSRFLRHADWVLRHTISFLWALFTVFDAFIIISVWCCSAVIVSHIPFHEHTFSIHYLKSIIWSFCRRFRSMFDDKLCWQSRCSSRSDDKKGKKKRIEKFILILHTCITASFQQRQTCFYCFCAAQDNKCSIQEKKDEKCQSH